MVDNRRLISSTLPIPNADALVKKMSICHFITNAPKKNPVKKRTKEKGRIFVTVLNSFLFRAGFKNDTVCISNIGKIVISPTATPTLIERLINWKGEVKTMLTPFKERRLTKNLIIFS